MFSRPLNWALTSLKELTLMIFNTRLTHLGLEIYKISFTNNNTDTYKFNLRVFSVKVEKNEKNYLWNFTNKSIKKVRVTLVKYATEFTNFAIYRRKLTVNSRNIIICIFIIKSRLLSVLECCINILNKC